jgi:hypothetical protein
MNNPKLKLAMARLLPEMIHITPSAEFGIVSHKFQWLASISGGRYLGREIYETEWLYVIHLVEQTLTWKQQVNYRKELQRQVTSKTLSDCVSATFNQRAEAMCKVKGIEIE